jgi:hypothetical protein
MNRNLLNLRRINMLKLILISISWFIIGFIPGFWFGEKCKTQKAKDNATQIQIGSLNIKEED